MSSVHWHCLACAEKWGQVFAGLMMPDEVFYEKVKQESFAHFGYYPTAEELQVVKDADCSPLATLLKEAR